MIMLFKGSLREIPTSQLQVQAEMLNIEGNNVSCRVAPFDYFSTVSVDVQPTSTPAAPIPSLMLTIPTPQLPASPVFIPQSPITISKYITASSRLASPLLVPAHASPVPSVPICEDCCLIPPESGQQCSSCERQWLACKVWYQANDGGRRLRLTEPYIKPAESNATNRALMELLGAPSGVTSSYGLGIRAAPEPVVSKSRFRKLAPLLALTTAESSASVSSGRQLLPSRGRRSAFLKRLGSEALTVPIQQFWAKLSWRIHYGSVSFFKNLLSIGESSTMASSTRSSLSRMGLHDDFLGDLQASRRLTITSTSRFLEHLVEPSSIP